MSCTDAKSIPRSLGFQLLLVIKEPLSKTIINLFPLHRTLFAQKQIRVLWRPSQHGNGSVLKLFFMDIQALTKLLDLLRGNSVEYLFNRECCRGLHIWVRFQSCLEMAVFHIDVPPCHPKTDLQVILPIKRNTTYASIFLKQTGAH